MKKLTTLLLLLTCLVVMTSSKSLTTIFIIGDSTAAEKSNPESNPERGWGMVFQGCVDDKILVDNHAVNGRSSKSFIDEGRWQKVLDKIKPGDYVFIQFGHNDEKPKADRHTDPGSTFDANLARFCNETRAKGGVPVLFSPVVRRNFLDKSRLSGNIRIAGEDDDEKLRNNVFDDGEEQINSDTLIDTHGAYRFSAGNVARKLGVVYIDANKITHDIEQSMGVKGSRKLHMWWKPGEIASIPKGRKDNTHYNIYGAHIMANAIAEEVGRQIPALKKHIRHYDIVVSAEGRGNYMDLQKAVDAVPMNKKTRILVIGGSWKKPNTPAGKKIKFIREFGAEIR